MRTAIDTPPAFEPPFCPNPNCKNHHGFHHRRQYKRHGAYYRLITPHRIPRFQCRQCRRSFSSQTFAASYWLKRPDVLPRLFMKTVGAMANRQIARDLGVSPSTVDRQLSRLGRHCLLFHQLLVANATVTGPLAIDGFETFEYSQYFPCHYNLAVEVESSFLPFFTDSPLRRKGRMRPDQKRRRAELEQRLGKPDPKAVEKGISELLRICFQGLTGGVLRRDDHPAYGRAIARLPLKLRQEITPSTQRRDADNALFEINRKDLLLRHSVANHRRETIAWAKRRQRGAERLAIFLVWCNVVKQCHEKGPPVTPAMLKGLTDRPLTVMEILAERLFPSRIELPGVWADYYWGRVETRALPVNRRHELKYAA